MTAIDLDGKEEIRSIDQNQFIDLFMGFKENTANITTAYLYLNYQYS